MVLGCSLETCLKDYQIRKAKNNLLKYDLKIKQQQTRVYLHFKGKNGNNSLARQDRVNQTDSFLSLYTHSLLALNKKQGYNGNADTTNLIMFHAERYNYIS